MDHGRAPCPKDRCEADSDDTVSRRSETPMKARVTITLKPGVLDPQGKAIEGALADLGFDGVSAARQGKIVDLDLNATDETAARAEVERMCEALLANTVVERYEIAIKP